MFKNIAQEYAGEVSIKMMEHSGYKAEIMAAQKLPDNGMVHPLPPGTPISIVPIHCLPGCPDDWVRESGSYVVPVCHDIGLWFNWRMNDEYCTAVVPSVKGMNPITGQKMEGCQMEQYRDICPIHKIPFAHGRYCEECKYSWPPQNYVWSAPLWIDGFFQSDGTTRQFFYTEDEKKDVATALIGKPNTMPAFGFAFFKYKYDRPKEILRTRGVYANFYVNESIGATVINNNLSVGSNSEYLKGVTFTSSNYDYCSTKTAGTNLCSNSNNAKKEEICAYNSVQSFMEDDSIQGFMEVNSEGDARSINQANYEKVESTKEVSVGAGAAIDQSLEVDIRPLSDYHAEPQALMRIYFCFEKQFKDIIKKGGIKKLEEKKHGFLNGVPVGG